MSDKRIKSLKVLTSKVEAVVFVGRDEDDFGRGVEMTVQIRRDNPEIAEALDALGVTVLKHADGVLNRAAKS
jgi:hypothetical protein